MSEKPKGKKLEEKNKVCFPAFSWNSIAFWKAWMINISQIIKEN